MAASHPLKDLVMAFNKRHRADERLLDQTLVVEAAGRRRRRVRVRVRVPFRPMSWIMRSARFQQGNLLKVLGKKCLRAVKRYTKLKRRLESMVAQNQRIYVQTEEEMMYLACKKAFQHARLEFRGAREDLLLLVTMAEVSGFPYIIVPSA